MALAGKTYLVTGSTDGIGRHTAERLCHAGAHVLVHGRSPGRVADTVASLGAAAGTAAGFVADFADLAQVRRLAAEVTAALGPAAAAGDPPPLTALINNAGVYEPSRATSADGLEMTWAVNVAAPFLLTSLLLDVVAARVVTVASVSAASSIDFDNLQQERGYSAHGAYSLSKLADIMLANELAARLAAAGRPAAPTSNSLDPGTVNTKMLYAGWGPIGMRVDQADDQFFVATDASLDGVTGRYFVGARERRPPAPASDPEARQRLWEVLLEQTGAVWTV